MSSVTPEDSDDERAKERDREHAGNPRDGVVDAGGHARTLGGRGAHHRGGQRRDADGHPEGQHQNAGKNVVQYEPLMSDLAYRTTPNVAMAGPTVSGSRLPRRATIPPDQRDRRNIRSGNGRNAAPASVAE